MTPRDAYRLTLQALKQAGVPDPAPDAGWLLGHVLNRPALEARLDMDSTLSPGQEALLRDLTQKRQARIPLQYLLRTQSFLGRSFSVDERALIPRPETELLAELAVSALGSSGRALDLCCGTGCLAITMALERPGCDIWAADLSPAALSLARENAARLGARVTFRQGDLFAPLQGETFDLIVSNPPYIPSAECPTLQEEVLHEPVMALDGGTDGLDFYRRIAREAPMHLTRGGRIMLELGDGEAEAVSALLADAGFEELVVHPDLQGLPRMLSGKI